MNAEPAPEPGPDPIVMPDGFQPDGTVILDEELAENPFTAPAPPPPPPDPED